MLNDTYRAAVPVSLPINLTKTYANAPQTQRTSYLAHLRPPLCRRPPCGALANHSILQIDKLFAMLMDGIAITSVLAGPQMAIMSGREMVEIIIYA